MSHTTRLRRRRPITYSAIGLALASSMLLAACGSSGQDAQRSAAENESLNLSNLSESQKQAVGVANQGQQYPLSACGFTSWTGTAGSSNRGWDMCNMITAAGTVGWSTDGKIGPIAIKVSGPSAAGIPATQNVAFDAAAVGWQPPSQAGSSKSGTFSVVTSSEWKYGQALAAKSVASSFEYGTNTGLVLGCSNSEYMRCSYEKVSQPGYNDYSGQAFTVVGFRTYPLSIEYVSLVGEKFAIDNESFVGLLRETVTSGAGALHALAPTTDPAEGPGVIRVGYRSSDQPLNYKAQLVGEDGTSGQVSLSFPAAPEELTPGKLKLDNGNHECNIYQTAPGAANRSCVVTVSNGSYDRVRIYITDGSAS